MDFSENGVNCYKITVAAHLELKYLVRVFLAIFLIPCRFVVIPYTKPCHDHGIMRHVIDFMILTGAAIRVVVVG